ncbi:hypothetical protein [Pelistega europaea]|uniref:Uncharacterized protein n=1 Tax=Pelistega europaea TaxID=106147 RepID=A0A7Y4LAI2_9BURK|nr:hypothetical protein [Pelistega europaea]NOL50014.1 hypothetical protein [Pelistega europaea]
MSRSNSASVVATLMISVVLSKAQPSGEEVLCERSEASTRARSVGRYERR